MTSLYTLELAGEIIEQSPHKADVISVGRRIARRALTHPPIRVGSATIIGIERGDHQSWELVERGGNSLLLTVNELADTREIPKEEV
jgi:hypothetical protein